MLIPYPIVSGTQSYDSIIKTICGRSMFDTFAMIGNNILLLLLALLILGTLSGIVVFLLRGDGVFRPDHRKETKPTAPPDKHPPAPSLFDRLKQGLSETRSLLANRLDTLFKNAHTVDPALYKALEEVLITSDIGIKTTTKLLDHLKRELKDPTDTAGAKSILINAVEKILSPPFQGNGSTQEGATTPHVILVVGVNGVGKTTTIGKLAAHHRAQGQSVLLVAGDTYRAAAVEQLEIWAMRTQSQFIKGNDGADPASVVYTGLQQAKSENVDLVIADTAGRLHTKKGLMDELRKVKSVARKVVDGAPHEVLLVLDATTGQNAINQAQEFMATVDITHIALTKLDGTAKGGVIIGILDELNIPVKYIGVGESVEDLQIFQPAEFSRALFS